MILIYAILIILVGYFFFRVYRRWPPDPHFGSHSTWALFLPSNEPLPWGLVERGIGCSRIYMFYIVKWLSQLFGKNDLHWRVWLAQFITFTLNGLLIYLLGIWLLNISPSYAVAGAILFLFACSRVQLLPIYLNGEPYYSLITSLSILLLLMIPYFPSFSLTLTAIAAFLYVFAAIHTKLPLLLEPAFIGLSLFYLYDWNYNFILMASFGAVLGIISFRLIFPKCSFITIIKSSLRYKNKSGLHSFKVNPLKMFVSRFRITFERTPMLALMVLAFVGLIISNWDRPHFLLSMWFLATILTLILQKRMAPYFFHVLLPPASLLVMQGLEKGSQVHSLFPLLAAMLFVFLARKSLFDLPLFYSSMSSEEIMARTISDYQFLWDTRIPLMLRHHQEHKNDFIAWTIAPQVYYQANHPPIGLYTVVHRYVRRFYPPAQENLVQNAIIKRPYWIYDFNAWNPGYGPFNPLTFYVLTGLKYLPVDRKHNLVVYQLIGVDSKLPHPEGTIEEFGITLEHTPVSDLYVGEISSVGIDIEEIPEFCTRDISELVLLWLEGRSEEFVFFEKNIEDKLVTIIERCNVTSLYLTIIALMQEDKARAKNYYSFWLSDDNNQLRDISTLLMVVTSIISRKLGISHISIDLDPKLMQTLSVDDAHRLIMFILEINRLGLLDEAEKKNLALLLDNIIIDDGVYRVEMIAKKENQLMEIKKRGL